MTAAGRTVSAWLAAAALLVACVGVMLLLAADPQPRPAPHSAAVSERLDAPQDIQGVPCTGYASFTPDGRLSGCILAREHSFGRVALPANTQVRRFHENLVPKDVHLGSDGVLDGHACLGRGPGEWMTGFHPDGRLAYCFLVADATIDGVPCRRGTFWGEVTGGVIVSLHDNGRLAACRLAADVTIAGQRYTKGARIGLDPEGKVVPDAKRRK